MAEIMDIMDAFSTPLKLAWVLWFAWAVGQIFWYRRERVFVGTTPAIAALPVAKTDAPARRAVRRSKPSEMIGLDLRTASQPPADDTPVDTRVDTSEFERAFRGLERMADNGAAHEITP